MDLDSIMPMVFSGGVVAGGVSVCASIRYR